MKLEAAGPHQGGIEAFDLIGGADDEDEFFLVEAVHFGEQLVDHRMLDAAAGIGAARGGERVEFVEHNDGGCRLPGAIENLPKIFFRFAYPFDFNSGPETIVMAAPMAAAMALAKNVLPVPGGPQKIMPRGISSSRRATSSSLVPRRVGPGRRGSLGGAVS